jgi:amino acid transporter
MNPTKLFVLYVIAFVLTFKFRYNWDNKVEISPNLKVEEKQEENLFGTLLLYCSTFLYNSTSFTISLILWIFFVEVWNITEFLTKTGQLQHEVNQITSPEISKVHRPRTMNR